MPERNYSDQASFGSSQNQNENDSHTYGTLTLNKKQISVLRALCGVLIGKLDKDELEILLNTNSSVVKKKLEKAEEFGIFDLSEKDDIVNKVMDRLSKYAPHKLQLVCLTLKRLGSKKGILNTQKLGGKPFHELSKKEREATFIKWSTSQQDSLRRIYKSFSTLICTTFWLDPYGFNSVIGYPETDPKLNNVPSRTFPEYNFLEISETDTEIREYNTIIIGSGAGGSVAAARLARVPGYSVLVLEKGHHYKQNEFSSEQKDGYDKLYELSGGMFSEDDGMYVLSGSNFGGGTTVSWSASMELQHFVREEWSKKGLPYFMEDDYGTAKKHINAKLGTNEKNITHNQCNQALIEGCKKLGFHVETIPQNSSSLQHQCGWCAFGCKNGEKQSAIMTWLNEAKSHDAKFIQDCYVKKVLYEKDEKKNQKVTGVEAIINGSKQVKIYADRVIVASGAIHTPALLLRSGLKNKNIGKNLHVHPTAAVYGVFPDRVVKPYSGTIMSAISNAVENTDGENYGAKIVVGSHHPAFMFSNFPWKSALQHKQLMLEYNHIVPLMVITRDREGGKVSIDSDDKPILEYKLSQHDAKSTISGLLAAIKILIAAGASKVGTCQAGVEDYIVKNSTNPLNDPQLENFLNKVKKVGIPVNQAYIGSIEQMSSCRMGDDPSKSVVNPAGETWEVENLYVADSSVLPTATGVPSMMTVMNVSHYISRCILERRNYVVKKKRGSILRQSIILKEPSIESTTNTVEDLVKEADSASKKDKRKSLKRMSLNLF